MESESISTGEYLSKSSIGETVDSLNDVMLILEKEKNKLLKEDDHNWLYFQRVYDFLVNKTGYLPF